MLRVYPTAIAADLHFHLWSAFSEKLPSGSNTRLEILLSEFERMCKTVTDRGGDSIILAGDVFHQRGSISPIVINRFTETLINMQAKYKVHFVVIPGNHDLELEKVTEESSAVTILKQFCAIYNEPANFPLKAYCPWIEDIDELKETLEKLALKYSKEGRKEADLIIHAPIDDVIKGLPNHGLTAEWLSLLGFKRVFSGHYHHHKDFGNGVYSIGALAHHTWSDVGSKAGFLIIEEDSVTWHKSHAPEFVDIDSSMSETDIQLLADQNYVRAKTDKIKTSEVNALRKFLTDAGAKGVVINAVKAPVVSRSAETTIAKGMTLTRSTSDFIELLKIDDDIKKKVATEALKTLYEASMETEE